MKVKCQGFLIKSGDRIRVNHKYTDSILINKLHVDLLLHFKHLFRGKLLDAGCGEKPYSLIYMNYIDKAIGCDVKTCKHNQKDVDIFASLDNLPFKDEEFDVILCTNVLEHVSNFSEAFSELARVLKKGGHIIISTPFLYPVHEAPYDFYRYTQNGLEKQMENNNLEVEKILSWGGPGLMLVVYLNFFFCKFLNIQILKSLSMQLQEVFYLIYKILFLKKIIRSRGKLSRKITTGFFVVGKKL